MGVACLPDRHLPSFSESDLLHGDVICLEGGVLVYVYTHNGRTHYRSERLRGGNLDSMGKVS